MSGLLNFFIFSSFWHGYTFNSVSYCTDLCGGKPIHTLCKYPTPSPNSQCAGWSDSRLKRVEKQRLLNKLNQRRDEVAAGRSRSVPTAANMLNLHWVEELAESAQRWADQCIAHTVPDTKDQCRDLLTMTAGQTIATVQGASSGLTATVMADMWYMDGLHYDGNVSSYIAPEPHAKDYSSFTQMVWATTFMVGCGRVKFMGHRGDRVQQLERLVCDWAPAGNVEGARVFAAGTPGSLCPTGSARGHRMKHLCVYQNDTLKELLRKLKPNESDIEYKFASHVDTTDSKTSTTPMTSAIIEKINSSLENPLVQKDNDTKSVDFDFLSGIQESMNAFREELLGFVNSTEITEEIKITTIKPQEVLKTRADKLLDMEFDTVSKGHKFKKLTTKRRQRLTTKGSNVTAHLSDMFINVLNVNASDIFKLFEEPVGSTSSSTKASTDEYEYDDDETIKGWTGPELIMPSEGPDVDDVTEFDEEITKASKFNKSTTSSDDESASSQDYNLLAIFTDKDSYYEVYELNTKQKSGNDDHDIYYDDDDADALKKSYNPSKENTHLQGKLKSKRDKNNPSEKLSSGVRQRKKSRKKNQKDLTEDIPKKVEDAVESLLKVLDGAFEATTNDSKATKHSKKQKHSRLKQTPNPLQNIVKEHPTESGVEPDNDNLKEIEYDDGFLKERGFTDNKDNIPEISASSRTEKHKKAITESLDEVFTEQSIIPTVPASDTNSENFEDDGTSTFNEPYEKTESKDGDKDDMLYYDDEANIATTTRRKILKKMQRTRTPHRRKGRTKKPSKIIVTPADAIRKVLTPNQYGGGERVTFFPSAPEPLGELEEPEFPQYFGLNSSLSSIPNAAKSFLRLFNDDIQKDNLPVPDVELSSNITDSEDSMPKQKQLKFFDDPEDMVNGNPFVPRRTDEELDEQLSFNEALEKVNSTDVLELFQSLRGYPVETTAEFRRHSKKNRRKEKGQSLQRNSSNKSSRNGHRSNKKRGNKNNRRRTKSGKTNKSRRSHPDDQLLSKKRDGKELFYDYSVENLNPKHANGSEFENYHEPTYTDVDVNTNSSAILNDYGSRRNKTTRFPLQVRMNEDQNNQTSPVNMLFDEMSQNPGDKLPNLVARRHANDTFLSEQQMSDADITTNFTTMLNVSQTLVSSTAELQIMNKLFFLAFLVFASSIKQ